MIKADLVRAFKNAQTKLSTFIDKKENFAKLEKICILVAESYRCDGKVLVSGNGGSMADAMHFAEELSGRFRVDRKALPAMPFSDPSYITCVANDYGYEEIFSRGVQAYGKEGDVFFGLSTSGNSKNIVKAVKIAKEMNLKVVLLLGKGGGELKGMGDIEIIINGKTSDRIQEIHMLILHTIVEGVERLLFPENYI